MPPKKTVVSPLAQIKEIEEDPRVKKLIEEKIPPNYDFEIGKCIWRIRKNPNCKAVALQFPEGLLIFSTRIASILTEITGVDCILMGDITYGACCIDDYTASMLGADLLIHYGHSCLVPTVVANKLDTIYIFVTIKINLDVAATAITAVISEEKQKQQQLLLLQNNTSKKIQYETETNEAESPNILFKVCLVSTIQFANSLGNLKKMLEDLDQSLSIQIPRAKPLSSGEILGCTAPKVDTDLIIYVGDGRFHLEAMMMANPEVTAYRYDPYNSTTTIETFDHGALANSRSKQLAKVLENVESPGSSKRIGIILGTLGRQGNPKPMEHVRNKFEEAGYNPFVLLMSEVMPAKLNLFQGVDGWVQFACPRLSIDWGDAFDKPIMTSYEGMMITELGRVNGKVGGGERKCCGGGEHCSKGGGADCQRCYSHPMDYYSFDSCGAHTPNHGGGVVVKPTKK